MGSGTLVELIARGKQDVFLIGNPQFSFFKSVYRRHTNFAMEPIRQIFLESPDFNKQVTCIIDKKADLLSDILLEIELPALQDTVSWTNGIGCNVYGACSYTSIDIIGDSYGISSSYIYSWVCSCSISNRSWSRPCITIISTCWCCRYGYACC